LEWWDLKRGAQNYQKRFVGTHFQTIDEGIRTIKVEKPCGSLLSAGVGAYRYVKALLATLQ